MVDQVNSWWPAGDKWRNQQPTMQALQACTWARSWPSSQPNTIPNDYTPGNLAAVLMKPPL